MTQRKPAPDQREARIRHIDFMLKSAQDDHWIQELNKERAELQAQLEQQKEDA